MVHVHIGHRVEDYERWKAAFDAFIDQRKGGGEQTYEIYRGLDDPNHLTLLFTWSSAEDARAFLDSAPLKEAMQSAGVIGPPDIKLTSQVARGQTN